MELFALNTASHSAVDGTAYTALRAADVDRYATIHDVMNPASETDVCGGSRRLSHVMTSRTHELQVNFIGSLVDERLPNFLLQYQGAQGTHTPTFVSRIKPRHSLHSFHSHFVTIKRARCVL